MKLILETPTKLRIADATEADIYRISETLKYKDRAVERQIRSYKQNQYFVRWPFGKT